MKNIAPFIKARQFEASLEHQGEQYGVRITLPELSGLQNTSWGDWGPMYTFTMPPKLGIELTYSSWSRRTTVACIAYPKYVLLNSPMSFAIRQKCPFFLEFQDEERGLRFFAFLDEGGSLVRTEVKSLDCATSLEHALFSDDGREKLSA